MFRFFCFVILFSGLLLGQDKFEEASKEYAVGNYSKVIDILKEQIPEDSSFYNFWYMLGISYQKNHNYNKASEALYTAYKFNKFDIKLNMALGINFKYSGAPSYSILFYKQVYELDSSNTSMLIELADSYFQIKNYNNAINVYKKLVNKDSSNAFFLKELGRCYYRINNVKEAISHLQKSFEINPRDAGVALLLGGLLVNLQQYDEAIKVIQDGLYDNGQSDQLLKLYAETLFKMKRYTSASVQYEAVIEGGDSTAVNYKKLGFCYYLPESMKPVTENDSLKYLPAIKAFSKAIEKDSSDALSYIYLGICWKEKGEYSRAADLLKWGIELSFPEYLVDAYSQLASGYEISGDYEEAIKAYKKAQEYDSKRRTITFQLASLYDKYYRDKQTPLLYYKKFLSENGDVEAALIDYAKKRIENLNEQMFFEHK